MTTITFDALAYLDRLKSAGFTEEQARTQTELLRDLNEAQARQAEAREAAMKETLSQFDEATRRDLATKGALRETELRLQKEIEKVRAELKVDIEKVRAEVEKVRADVEKVKYDLLKWQLAGWLALAAIMAKGFNWIGF